MRNPVAAEIFNEEVSNLLKRKIKDSVTRVDELGIAFDYEGEVTADDADADPGQGGGHVRPGRRGDRAGRLDRSAGTPSACSRPTFRRRSTGSSRTSSTRTCCAIVDDVVTTIKGSIELWPTLVEICYFEKDRRGLPRTKVNNRRAG